MEGAFAATERSTVPHAATLRREYTIRVTRPLRETLDTLAEKYDLYTPEGATRDAEITRVLLVCALTEGLPPHEQATIALYVNGLMLVSQGLWLGLYDVRDDLVETMRNVVGPRKGLKRRGETRPGNPPRDPDRERFHVKVDDWIRTQLATVAAEGGSVRDGGFVREDGTVLDALLVTKFIEKAVHRPSVYERAFSIYAPGITQVRLGLIEGLTAVRDALREAVVEAAGGR